MSAAASLREAAQNALVTLDGIADTNPRNTADFETPAEWITWAKSRARWAADALRAPIAQEIHAERILKKMLHDASNEQTEKKCGTCGFIGQEDPVKGCPKCGFDDMRAMRQTTLLTRQEMLAAILPLTDSNAAAEIILDISADEYRAIEAAILAKLQATQAEPMFWVRLRSDGGYEGPIHNAVIEDVRRMSGAWHPLYLGSEPVQAGELPDEREAFEAWAQKRLQLNIERCAPPEQGFYTWQSTMDAWMAWQARAAIAARKPLAGLTREQMEAGRHQVFSTNNPFCPCDSKTFRKVSEWTEREFCRINGLEVKP